MSATPYIVGGVSIAALGVGAYFYYAYSKQSATLALSSGGGSADSTVGSLVTNVEAAIVGWKNVGKSADWLQTLEDTESKYNLPTDLLARIAFEESHFREEIIRGTLSSPAGALGIMQLEPAYFPSVTAPVPFSDEDVAKQIDDAGADLQRLYNRFSSWPWAIAAYNAGEGNVHKYNGIPPFPETEKYVSDITADVPGLA